MKMKVISIFVVVAVWLLHHSCRKEEYIEPKAQLTPYILSYPSYFPEMPVHPYNPATVEGVTLGRYLYYDTLLSNVGLSCSSCHFQANSFTNPAENSLAHINLAWSNSFLWNGSVNGTLEDAMLFEVEDFFQTDLARLNSNVFYKEKFKLVYDVDYISSKEVSYALAQFVRSLISGNSKFDRYMRYEEMLTMSELSGYSIFNSERGDCFHCHSIGLFTDNRFHNIGLDSVFDQTNSGYYEYTGATADIGKFKTPTLRNVALTAPYMNDGRFQTLSEVIEHYNTGVKITPTVDPVLTKPNHLYGLNLTMQDKADLEAFLLCLTDTSYTANPQFSNPN